jgi:mannosyltransferase OCH1-like enzyme
MQDLKIPKMLHFIWLGSPMPEHMERNVTEWQRLNPDWNAYLWTDKNIPILRHSELYRRAKDLVPRDAVYQFQSDIIRLELLYDFGGFYADTDTRPLRPLRDALGGLEVFAAAEDRNWVGNTYLGATPGHPIFRDLLSGLAANVRRLKGKRPNHLSGPRYVTPIWRAHKGYVAPSHQWYPYSYTNVKNGTIPSDFDTNVMAVHEWFHTQTLLDNRRSRYSA